MSNNSHTHIVKYKTYFLVLLALLTFTTISVLITETVGEFDFQVDYIAMNNIDITEADEFVESFTNTGSETFEVPEAGTWYFFIYMDTFVNYEESVYITFEVQFNSDINKYF